MCILMDDTDEEGISAVLIYANEAWTMDYFIQNGFYSKLDSVGWKCVSSLDRQISLLHKCFDD